MQQPFQTTHQLSHFSLSFSLSLSSPVARAPTADSPVTLCIKYVMLELQVSLNKLISSNKCLPQFQHITCGLYYKPMTIVNDNSRVVYKLEALLTDDARVIIYHHSASHWWPLKQTVIPMVHFQVLQKDIKTLQLSVFISQIFSLPHIKFIKFITHKNTKYVEWPGAHNSIPFN